MKDRKKKEERKTGQKREEEKQDVNQSLVGNGRRILDCKKAVMNKSRRQGMRRKSKQNAFMSNKSAWSFRR